MIDLDSHANWCLSGGATGADLFWGRIAACKGHGVVHFSFKGHKTGAPKHELVELSDHQLWQADGACQSAARLLRRYFPPKSTFVANLLRRNWYQVRDADSCYAISSIKDGLVEGGTGWAVAMYIDRHGGVACPVYVFDQNVSHWFQWTGTWEPIYEPPPPAGVWAGIGTRKLNWMGSLAIKVLMDYGPANTARNSYYHGGYAPSVRSFTMSSGV